MRPPRRVRHAAERRAQRSDVDVRALAQQLADIGIDGPGAAALVAAAAREDDVLRDHVTAARARHEVLAREVATPQLPTAPYARATVALDQFFHRQRHPPR